MLSYSFQPEGPVRDQIPLRMRSFITSSVSRREIHIDGERVTFHIRALSQEDFELWMAALRKFVIVRQGSETLKRLSMPRTHSFPIATLAHKALAVTNDMHHTIAQLDEAYSFLRDDDTHSVRPSIIKGKREKDHGKDASSQGLFGIFRHSHKSPSQPPTTLPEPTTDLFIHRPGSSITLHQTGLERLHAVIETLHAQHAVLVETVTALAQADIAPPSANRLNSVLSTHAEGDEPISYSPVASARRMSLHSSRNSISSGSVWYDAEDGAEELVLEDEPEDMAPIIVDDGASEESVEAALEADHDKREPSEASKEEPRPAPIIRRTCLPVPCSKEEVSMIGVFRKNIGKVCRVSIAS